ncbi:MAG: hypothetical protein ABFS16_04305 [Bacteroidota bacterium]
MRLTEIIRLTNAKLVVGDAIENKDVQKAFSSDLMSDVLTLDEENILLITGLSNIQLIRTAEMAEVDVVLIARDKKASDDMIQLAIDNDLVLLETPYSVFKTSGILFSNGLNPVY